MNENEFRDTRLVWHCSNRHNEMCKKHNFCKGTICASYMPSKNSYHDTIDKITGSNNKQKKGR